MKEVYINGILCDLSEKDNPIALTYEVNNLAELKDRQAYSTNNFKLPPTQNNRAACGFPDSGSIIGLQPYRKNTCKIIQNGIEILTNGIALITGCGDFINVQALSGLIGFFDMLEGKSIRDLDFSDYDHVWNMGNIVSSQGNTEGYVWPIIDYGSLDEVYRVIYLQQLRPAVFRKTIIEKIVSEAGFTFEGEILTDEKHTKSIIPFSLDRFEHSKRFIDTLNSYSVKANQLSSQGFSKDIREQNLIFEDNSTVDPGGFWTGQEYTAPVNMKVGIALKYNIDVRDMRKGGSIPSTWVKIQHYNGVWNTISENQHLASSPAFVTDRYEDQIQEPEAILKAGEKIRVLVRHEPDTDRILAVIDSASIAITYKAQDVVFGQVIQLEATLPDISQKDFFKDFMQNFGLIAIPDNYRKHIKLVNMSEVYGNKFKALDWTDKFSNSIQNIDYSFGNYGVNNYGKYKEDDAVPEGVGTGNLILDNQTLKQEVDLFTSKFAASISLIKMSGISVTEIKKIEDPLKSLDFKIKTEPRILLDKKENTTVNFFDRDSTSTFLLDTISLPKFEGLGYEYLFPEYYEEILRMLYRPFTIDRKILLTPVDLANLDFTVPVYDKKTGAYYYNNGIKNYIDGEECTISLIKMQ